MIQLWSLQGGLYSALPHPGWVSAQSPVSWPFYQFYKYSNFLSTMWFKALQEIVNDKAVVVTGLQRLQTGGANTVPITATRQCVCAVCLVPQSWPTVCDPLDCSPPGSSVHGVSQAGTLESGIEPTSLVSPALQADSLLLSHWGSCIVLVALFKEFFMGLFPSTL